MFGQDLREMIEDLAVGFVISWQWFEDHGKGVVTFLLAAVYMIYKILHQRHKASIAKHERDLLRLQVDKWSELTNSDLIQMQEKLKKDVQTK